MVGREKFKLILPHTDLHQTQVVAEKQRQIMAQDNLPIIGTKTGIFGVTAYADGDILENHLLRTGRALHHSKNLGRNRASTIAAP